jgi:hypothetical protein
MNNIIRLNFNFTTFFIIPMTKKFKDIVEKGMISQFKNWLMILRYRSTEPTNYMSSFVTFRRMSEMTGLSCSEL